MFSSATIAGSTFSWLLYHQVYFSVIQLILLPQNSFRYH
jgi:hypothetical protein